MMIQSTRMLSLLALLALALPACGEEEGAARPLTEQEQSLVASSNQFGFGFFGEVLAQSDGGNVFVSPLSVSMALGMTYNGARGDTEVGMRQTLSYGELSTAEINEGYRGLIDLLCQLDPEVTMEIANSIWYREGFEVLQSFIDVNTAFFDAVVSALDFDDPSAADTINAWVNQKTHGKIEAIVEPPIDPLTVMFLINAVYFKGCWTYRFDPENTCDQVFHTAGGEDELVPMMRLRGDLASLYAEHYRAVHLPYGNRKFGMTVILPHPGEDIDDVAASFDRQGWENLQADMKESELRLFLPRFEMTYDKTLNDVLAALGMEVAFGDAADFSGMSPLGEELFISEVKHKSWVQVDEEGTRAAAATSVEIGQRSTPDELVVDRPFLFVIHDSHSKALLFMGKVADPGA